jgi:hypothetical protein
MGKFTRGCEALEVHLLDYTRNIAEKNFLALRTTWTEYMDHPYDPSDPLCIKFIRDLMNHKLFGTFIKEATLFFQFKNVSRICLAQMTRDRWHSVASQSNMPQPLSHEITIPKYIYDNPKWRAKLESIQENIEDLYNELTVAGVPFQDSRYIGMHGQQITFTATCDVEEFQRQCRSRLNNMTHDEINFVLRLAKRALRQQIEEDHDNGSLDDLSYYMWDKFERAADVGESTTKKTAFFDPLFGGDNKWLRYPRAENAKPMKPLFNFEKLSWKRELEDLYDSKKWDLLLPDEKEMIERWRDDSIKTDS